MLTCALVLLSGPSSPTAALIPTPGADQEKQEKQEKQSKADRLESKAMGLLAEGDTDYWTTAANLLEESARLRSDENMSRATSLKLAANLYCWSGDREKARALFQESAEQAYELGEGAFAAHTFMDAALLSATLQMGRHTVEAAQMAEQIAAAPDLTQAERESIRSRLDRLDLPTRLADIM
jgi:hypothetical protein